MQLLLETSWIILPCSDVKRRQEIQEKFQNSQCTKGAGDQKSGRIRSHKLSPERYSEGGQGNSGIVSRLRKVMQHSCLATFNVSYSPLRCLLKFTSRYVVDRNFFAYERAFLTLLYCCSAKICIFSPNRPFI